MSMKLLTILQFLSAFGTYLLMTVLLPALIFYRKLRKERFCIRFLFYLTIGNFFLMNLVFLLQLLHISYRFTLIPGTIVPAFFAAVWLNEIPVKKMAKQCLDGIFSLSKGTLGWKLVLSRALAQCKIVVKTRGKKLFGSICRHLPDLVFFLLLTALLLYMYGTNMLSQYGYAASDLPVHNYWINGMGQNNIFVAGVYPFGFHCVIYYLHTVFGIETFVLLRVFGVVQVLFVHYALLAFLKYCCRMRYTAYGAVGLYAAASFLGANTYTRFHSALPQEFGIIFILPSICFVFAFLKERKKEEGKKRWVHSTWYLCGFVMNFAMTLGVHFYGTMVAGLFCAGIAAGYGFRVFRKKYFGRIMLAGIISVFLAVLPMGVAFASGTPLQGSLGWGLKIITGEGEDKEETATEDLEQPKEDTEASGQAGGAAGTVENGTETPGTEAADSGQTASPVKVTFTDRVNGILQKGKNLILSFGSSTWKNFQNYIIFDASPVLLMVILLSPVFLAAAGLLFLLFPKSRDYGGILLSTAFAALFMIALLSADTLGLPALMDKNRCSIYLAYLLPVIFGLAVDAALMILTGFIKRRAVPDALSALVTIGLMAALIHTNQVRKPDIVIPLETNSAITCLTNILRDNEDKTYTICSANDELRMVEDYGYHYETITFLRNMEGGGVNRPLTMPTPRVYFFIEKIPLDYTITYAGSGQNVSEQGAALSLPNGSGLTIYQGENRWIVMSRMYYWAKEFADLYKNEMKVYYETDEFICYVIEQNTYFLYDFAIDYGYNTAAWKEEETDDIP